MLELELLEVLEVLELLKVELSCFSGWAVVVAAVVVMLWL